MIFPKCGKEMILGRIETTDAYVTYVINNKDDLPENDKFARYYPVNQKFIPLSKRRNTLFNKLAKAESYYCPNCEFIITPIKDFY